MKAISEKKVTIVLENQDDIVDFLNVVESGINSLNNNKDLHNDFRLRYLNFAKKLREEINF